MGGVKGRDDCIAASNDRLLKAAKRLVEIDEAHGLPDENASFDAYNEWVAALYALKEAVRDADE